jgi:hypothetical protein
VYDNKKAQIQMLIGQTAQPQPLQPAPAALGGFSSPAPNQTFGQPSPAFGFSPQPQAQPFVVSGGIANSYGSPANSPAPVGHQGFAAGSNAASNPFAANPFATASSNPFASSTTPAFASNTTNPFQVSSSTQNSNNPFG